MLLFDDSKKLEKALGEEAAAVIAHVFEKVNDDNKRELATRADLENALLAVKADLAKLELSAKTDLEKLELRLKHDLTLRLGGMLGASIAIVAALVRLL